MSQPPSGGCVLKQTSHLMCGQHRLQPPSGGCVLKQLGVHIPNQVNASAALGRLCVETAASFLIMAADEISRPRAAVC